MPRPAVDTLETGVAVVASSTVDFDGGLAEDRLVALLVGPDGHVPDGRDVRMTLGTAVLDHLQILSGRQPRRPASRAQLVQGGAGRAPDRRWLPGLSYPRRAALASWRGCRMRRYDARQVLLNDGGDDRDDKCRGQRDPDDEPEEHEHDGQDDHSRRDGEHSGVGDRSMQRSIGPAEG